MKSSIIALDTIGPVAETPRVSSWDQARSAVAAWDADLTLTRTTHGEMAPTRIDDRIALRFGDEAPIPLSPWAYGQLCATIGAPVGFVRRLSSELQEQVLRDRWSSVAPETVRHVRTHGEHVSAILGPRFTPIDYTETVDLATRIFPDMEFAEAAFGSLMMRLLARNPDPIVELDAGPVFAGIEIRNSEVGFSAWEILLSLWIPECANGITLRLGSRSLFRCLHVGWTEEKLMAAIEKADPAGAVAERSGDLADLIRDARIDTWTADQVRAALIKPLSPRAKKATGGEEVNGRTFEVLGYRPALRVAESVVEEFARTEDQDPNLWGLIQAITRVSQSEAIHDRAALDEWAGRFLTKAGPILHASS